MFYTFIIIRNCLGILVGRQNG